MGTVTWIGDEKRDPHLWAIVLAAGEGERLADVTRAVHGLPVPKQYAAICGARTFLQRTMDRVLDLVPAHRTVLVVEASHRRLAERQLEEWPGAEIVLQPSNRGTGAGVLLPLSHVLVRDPKARVVVFPSDHHIERVARFKAALGQAIDVAVRSSAGICLVGAAAESAATDLVWIACGNKSPGSEARRVENFVEKPTAERALELLKQGALWNASILAADGKALWNLASRHIPRVEGPLYRYWQHLKRGGLLNPTELLREIYSALPPTDFSRDVLEHSKELLAVPMIDAGWSDCGTPERLRQALLANGGRSPAVVNLHPEADRSISGRAAGRRAASQPGRQS